MKTNLENVKKIDLRLASHIDISMKEMSKNIALVSLGDILHVISVLFHILLEIFVCHMFPIPSNILSATDSQLN